MTLAMPFIAEPAAVAAAGRAPHQPPLPTTATPEDCGTAGRYGLTSAGPGGAPSFCANTAAALDTTAATSHRDSCVVLLALLYMCGPPSLYTQFCNNPYASRQGKIETGWTADAGCSQETRLLLPGGGARRA